MVMTRLAPGRTIPACPSRCTRPGPCPGYQGCNRLLGELLASGVLVVIPDVASEEFEVVQKIESVIRSCADDFLDPSNAGPNFTWLGTFPRYAERYAISQLWMGGVEPTRLHRSVARDLARKVAAEYALRDQDKAGPEVSAGREGRP